MAKLTEAAYEDVFSPQTLQTLRGKSGESLRNMLGNKTLLQTMMRSQELLDQISESENNYKDLLEQIAIDMVTEAYPIITYADIKIEAKIGGNVEISPNDDEDNTPTELPNTPEIDPTFKRRIINGITHGSAVRGAFGYLLFREYLDRIDDSLVEKYREILKLTFGVYDSDEAIAMMLAMLANNQKIEGGSSEAEYNEDEEGQEGTFTIKANALNFPFLVHEIVKGLYEILSLQGFGPDLEQNKSIAKQVDVIGNEPEDLRMGKFIYDSISNLYNESDYNDTRIREFLFVEIYKLGDEEFKSLIENAINETLTSSQKLWVKNTMKEISDFLHKDDLPDDF